MNDLISRLINTSEFKNVFYIFIICYYLFGIVLIRKTTKITYIGMSIMIAIIGIIGVSRMPTIANKVVENHILGEAMAEVRYFSSDEYRDYAESLPKYSEEKMEADINIIAALNCEMKSWKVGDTAYEEYAKTHSFYDNKKTYMSEIKSPIYYSIITFYITYGVLFALVMLPVKLANDAKLKQKNTIGLISLLFGGTIIVWIVMMIWVSSLKNAAQSVVNINNDISSATKIKELKDLLDNGLITQEEYEAKRQEMLSKM